MNSMTVQTFRQWIRRIYNTLEEELDCEAFANLVPQYVDAQIAGAQADARFPQAKHHIIQCSECCDLYHTLYDMALIESRATHAEAVEPQQHDVASRQTAPELS